jgi:L-fuconolactonase
MDHTIRVDAHHHVWDLSVRDQEWTRDLPALHQSFSLEDLRPLLDQNGIDATIVVQTLNVREETPELLVLAQQNDVVAGVVGWVELSDEGVADEIAQLRASTGGEFLVGLRHVAQDESDDEWTCRPDVLMGLRAVSDAQLVYDLLVREHQLPSAITAVRTLPELRFVLDHFGKPLIDTGDMEPWRTRMIELARFENVAVKFSGLVTEVVSRPWRVEDLTPYVEVVLSLFGTERVMFGSDWPVCQIAASYAEMLDAAHELTSELTASEKDALFGATAAHWYTLDVA